MEELPGYDAWLESPYTDAGEPCEHECLECYGLGTSENGEECEYCEGQGWCDGDCGPGDPPEPDDYED